MPKKFRQENTKAFEARARKDAQKVAERERLEKEKEDELWRDDDKHLARKQQRKVRKCRFGQTQFVTILAHFSLFYSFIIVCA